MSEKEITQTIMFINTLGYYQCYDAVKEWFKWDDKTTKENIKFARLILQNEKMNKILSDKQFDCLMNRYQENQNKDE
jgi:hypothetical protein